MTPEPSDAALAQLRLRYRHIAVLAESYLAAGFNTVVEDVVLGDQLLSFVDLFTFRPLHLVVLAPDADTVARREAAREKSAYGADRWLVGQLDQVLREQTPRLGLWLDTSVLSAEATVHEILRRSAEAVVDGVPEAGH